MKKLLALFILSILSASCTIIQEVEPADVPESASLCIIEDTKVREGFLSELLKAFEKNGIESRIIPEGSEVNTCEWTATYMALWSWDITIYMSFAEIKVYKNGVLDGEAVYDSRGGSGNMDKFIDAEPKIHELVDELLRKHQSLFELKKFA